MKYFEFSEFHEILLLIVNYVGFHGIMWNPFGFNEIYHEIHNKIWWISYELVLDFMKTCEILLDLMKSCKIL